MTQSEWQSSCAIGLASCRLRAESLARQVYCKPFPSMDERPSAAAVAPHPPPVRQQPGTASTSQTGLLAIENGTAGGNPWPPPQLPPPDNFLVRTGRALYDRLYSLLQDQAVDCVVQYCEQGDQEPSSTSLDNEDFVVGSVPVPQEAVIAAGGIEESSSVDSEDAPTYPPEHEVARAALAHRRLPEVDGYPFPVVQELVRPGVTVQNSDDSSSSEAAEEPFHDATEGLAEEFRDESSCSSSEKTSEERVQVLDVAKAESPSSSATPDLPSPPSRTRSHRFAKHRFTEAQRPVVRREVETTESQSFVPLGRPEDSLPSSDSTTPELSSPSPGEWTSTPPTPRKPDSDDEDSADVRGPLVRSTSLKTGKSPPGTPFKKKIVRFADAMGLDLAAVRTIVSEDIPQIPASAFSDLRGIEPRVHAPSPMHVTLVPLFPQPGASPNFWNRLTTQKVCLESVVVTGCALHIVIRVLNVAFEKLVVLRYSLNEWQSFCDLRALYLPLPSDGPSDGLSDRFGVDLYLPSEGRPRLQMCVRYVVGESEFWDNNAGTNYRFEFRDSPKDELEVTPLMNYL